MGCQPSHEALAVHATTQPGTKPAVITANSGVGANKNSAITVVRAAAAAAEMASKGSTENTFVSLGYRQRQDDQSENPLTVEQRRIIKECWTQISPNLIAIGKKVGVLYF